MTAVLDKPILIDDAPIYKKPITVSSAIKVEAAGEFYTYESGGWITLSVEFDTVYPAALTHTEIADHLERALILLRTNGWAQGTSRDNQGHICAGWAINGAQNAASSVALTVNRALLIYLNEGRLLQWHHVPGWNDAKGRTFEQIEEGFLGAIDRERKLAAEAGELP